ncbi:MAG: glycosyltransferase family 87 protein [Bacteroidales bacterium]
MNISNLIKSIEDFFTERRLLYTLLGLIFIVFIAILMFSEGYSGGADSLTHYRFARWAFSKPEFFLDHWAKPIFTLLSSPFAILGFKSFQLFNILIGMASGYIAYLVAKELKMKSPLLAIVICSFTPVFMINLFSGLTEILFAFTAILTSYLLIKGKYTWGAIVISFLPLVRTEGIVLLPIYAYFLVHKKHYREIAFMFTGFVLYSLVGFMSGKSLFWLITEMPYHSAVDIYGKGSLFQFAKRSPGFFGIPNEIFFVTGLAAGLSLYIRQKKEYSKEFLLIVMPFLTYFIAHSISWWSGIGSSLGLSRYMAAIVPFMAVMATRGLILVSLMFQIIFKREWIRVLALILGVASVTHIPFVLQNYPIALDNASKTIKDASEWIKKEKLDTAKIYYTDPTFFYFHKINPFNISKSQASFNNVNNPTEGLNNGDLLIYDEHFSPIAGVELSKLIGNNELKLLRIFNPATPFNIFQRSYKIAVFQKIDADSTVVSNNTKILNGEDEIFTTLAFYDFDNSIYEPEAKFIGSSKIHSSKYLRIKRSREYSLTNDFKVDSISFISPLELQIEMKLFLKTPNEKLKYVVDVNKKNKRIVYKSFEIDIPTNSNPEEWVDINFKIQIPEIEGKKGINIRTYIWNKKEGEYLIDDYKVSYRVQ